MDYTSDSIAIWNRAAADFKCRQPKPGDHALAALLRMHGSVMNSGVLGAIEMMPNFEFEESLRGYEFFGFDATRALLDSAAHQQPSAIDSSTQEEAIDSAYRAMIPDDSYVFSAFEKHLRENPGDFSPASQG